MAEEALARRFERFANAECRGSSPLYERLALGIAADPELLGLAALAVSGPVPNLFFGAVHFLLLQGARHPVVSFYASISGAPPPKGDPYPHFRAYCLAHRDPIHELLSTRRVQTNEVRRCACLLPAFGLVAGEARGRPLALIEIGASAGLNLLWDCYGYDYGRGRVYGDDASPVRISCVLRGSLLPPFPRTLPEIAFRVGLDLHPIDVRDAEAALWLRALIWPEHAERADILQRALGLARQEPPGLIAGDALDRLPGTFAALPGGAVACVFHTFTLNQFAPEARERLSSLLAQEALRRSLYRISIEWTRGESQPLLALATFADGCATQQVLARCQSHGEWIEWLTDSPCT